MKRFTLAIHVLFFAILAVQGGTGSKKSTVQLDDGNIMEEVNLDETINAVDELKAEKGTHHFGRQLLQPLITVAGGALDRLGKALGKPGGGLDTNESFMGHAVDSVKKRLQAIYPGTRWCGDGNKAANEEDLGRFDKADSCCRAHDMCPENIPAGGVKHGLLNNGVFTRSHCDCDNAFYSCLKEASGLVAKQIGITYFSILGPQCFKEEFHVTGCIHYSRGKCMEYKMDPAQTKSYQWFDSPLYI